MGTFQFKNFEIEQGRSSMKVGTDSMVLGALIEPGDYKRALDIGAGSGVLSLMIAQKTKGTLITAVEIDNSSFLDCQLNFSNSIWSNRLESLNVDFLSFSSKEKFDLIFSNPPFYKDSLINPDEVKARARHEAFLPIKILCSKVKQLLNEKGKFWIVFPSTNKFELIEIANEIGLFPEIDYLVNGKPGKPVRCIVCFGKESIQNIKCDEITIRDKEGNYTDEYRRLTENYHSKKI